jgi:hypothetical protein
VIGSEFVFIVTEDSEGPAKRGFVIMSSGPRRGEWEVEEDLSFLRDVLQLRCWRRSAPILGVERERLSCEFAVSLLLLVFLRARYNLGGSASQIAGFRGFPHEMFSPWYQQGSCFCHQMLVIWQEGDGIWTNLCCKKILEAERSNPVSC